MSHNRNNNIQGISKSKNTPYYSSKLGENDITPMYATACELSMLTCNVGIYNVAFEPISDYIPHKIVNTYKQKTKLDNNNNVYNVKPYKYKTSLTKTYSTRQPTPMSYYKDTNKNEHTIKQKTKNKSDHLKLDNNNNVYNVKPYKYKTSSTKTYSTRQPTPMSYYKDTIK